VKLTMKPTDTDWLKSLSVLKFYFSWH